MTTSITPAAGARARQNTYWRARNAWNPQILAPAETWHIKAGHPGGAYSDHGHEPIAPDQHVPTLLTRQPAGPRCPGEYRGACLGCEWEGDPHTGPGQWKQGHNSAVEDAHDHAYPGWRKLPGIKKIKDAWDLPHNRRLWGQLSSCYPSGWIAAGAPLLVWARHPGDPHDPPFGTRTRYELRVDRPTAVTPTNPVEQGSLF
ncbi:DUF6349 family protein [Streptomyces sp. NPDC056773]|uniref:DUF6349 family protein n=1 Tax=unclassified Streptomyces TaxID=2593676 RepID=UPI0036AE24BF